MSVKARPTLHRLFEGFHRQLEAELGIARDTFDHPGTKGTLSEDCWIKMLREHLPKRYQVNRAAVVDSHDEVSDAIDVVVHDRQYSPFVINQGGAMFVPAESVYAVLEVKQNMDAGQVEYAADKIASVRKLHRTSLPIKHAGGEYPAKPPHYILGGLVTLESDWNPPFGDYFRSAVRGVRRDGRLDIGCAVRHGVFEAMYPRDKPPVVIAKQASASLALFMLQFIARLQAVATVPCIDVLAYAAKLDAKDA